MMVTMIYGTGRSVVGSTSTGTSKVVGSAMAENDEPGGNDEIKIQIHASFLIRFESDNLDKLIKPTSAVTMVHGERRTVE